MNKFILYFCMAAAALLLFGLMFVKVPGDADSPKLSEAHPIAVQPSPEVQPMPVSAAEIPAPPPSVEAAPAPTVSTPEQTVPIGTVVLNIPVGASDDSIPAVMAINFSDPHFDANDVQRIKMIVDRFTKEVNSGSINPNDSAYLGRWQIAAQEANDNFRLMVNQEDFLKYSLAASMIPDNQ